MDSQVFGASSVAPLAADQAPASVTPDVTPQQPMSVPNFVPIGTPEFAPSAAPSDTPPPATPDSPAPPAPSNEPDYRALYEQAAPQVQQYQQMWQQVEQAARQAEQQRQEEAAQAQFRSRRDTIYDTANRMPPEDAFQYIRRNEDQEIANLYNQIGQIRQASQQQAYQAVRQVSGPLYAQHLADTHQLPKEYAQRLAMLPPEQMDGYLPVLKQEYQRSTQQQHQADQRYQDLLQRFDQLSRTQQAQGLMASGAHTVTTETSAPAAVVQPMAYPNTVNPGSAESRNLLMSMDPRVAEMFGYRPA